MNIEMREMRRDEAALAKKTGDASFGLFERLVIQKPKQAFLAILDEQIVGMASYRIFPAKNKQKIGYVETGYVKKGYESRGIGSQLYQKATVYLKEQGCETVTATVKDDNVASWKLFENYGYHITGFGQMLQRYGLGSAILLWLRSSLAFATGFHLWSTMPEKRSTSTAQIGIFAFLNLLVLLPALAFGDSLAVVGIRVAAFASVLSASLLGGLIAIAFSKEKWCFRVARGGLLVSAAVTMLGGIWPVVGRFYPAEYKRTAVFRRGMGFEGLFEWLAILLMVAVAALLKDQSPFWKTTLLLGTNLLFTHALPMYPFECFGGKRIWDYNKALSAFTMIVSLALIFLVYGI